MSSPTPKPELYKDKIEVALDGRQIFYLFFGGAVIVAMVFVLGVMVGRRVEARGHVDAQARTEQRTDPLAALDKLDSKGSTYQATLTGGAPEAPSKVESLIADLAKAKPDKGDKADKKPVKAEEPKADDAPAPMIEEPAAEPKAEPKADKKDVAKKDEPKADKKDDAKKDEPKKDEPKKDDKKKGRYTVQLSSFQDKGEAEAFLANVKSSGFSATLTEAEITGKTYYRVRLGTYRSIDAANDAKADYEKSAKKSASVMKL